MKHVPPPRRGQPMSIEIRVARIDPWAKMVTLHQIPMTPAAIQLMTGKPAPTMAVIDEARKVQVAVIGDHTPQINLLVPGEVEPSWSMEGAHGKRTPVCHGIGLVVGLIPGPKKAASVPVTLPWIEERVRWGETEEKHGVGNEDEAAGDHRDAGGDGSGTAGG